MMKKKWTDRIEKIISLIPKCEILADVGCDHAHISISLKELGRVSEVIASDLREGPLERARQNVKKKGMENCFRFLLCDGLSDFKIGEVDAILISGMGGIAVKTILEKGIEIVKSAKTLVLEPQSDVCLVREFLRKNGFYIDEERMVKESGKYYQMMRANNVGENMEVEESSVFDKYGRSLLLQKDELLNEFLMERKNHYETLLKEIEQKEFLHKNTEERVVVLKKELEDVNKALSYYP